MKFNPAAIKTARIQKGLSAKTLAYQVGVGMQSIYDYENGLYDPGIDVFIKILNTLNLKLEDVLLEVSENQEAA